MWPPETHYSHRLRSRVLCRLGRAERARTTFVHKDQALHTLYVLGEGLLAARDDPVLYTHWTGEAVPRILTRAYTLETRLWEHLGSTIATLHRQGYYPGAFRAEASTHLGAIDGLQDALQSELFLAPDPADPYGADLLTRAIEHTKHYFTNS